MNRIYISDNGDDKNDGRTRHTAIYSWKAGHQALRRQRRGTLDAGRCHVAKAYSGNREAKEKLKRAPTEADAPFPPFLLFSKSIFGKSSKLVIGMG